MKIFNKPKEEREALTLGDAEVGQLVEFHSDDVSGYYLVMTEGTGNERVVINIENMERSVCDVLNPVIIYPNAHIKLGEPQEHK